MQYTTMSDTLKKLELEFNPFEPSASGAPLGSDLVLPAPLAERAQHLLDRLRTGHGVKAIVVVGEYGFGKTCLLQWLHDQIFPERRIKPFYFDNPGVQFYDLANALLKTIGRKDFAKFIWEYAGPHVPTPYQSSLFQRSFEEYLSSPVRGRSQPNLTEPLQQAVMQAGITTDEQIAHCLARVVTDSRKKPYFEYRDFIPRQSSSLVAEAEEAPYFGAILKMISRGLSADGIAFLIDEFEEIGLQKRLTRRAAHDYLATLKRLINLAQSEESNFWLVLSMTPDAYERTCALEPALAERLSGQEHEIRIEPLTSEAAKGLVRTRMDAARPEGSSRRGSLFPFPEDVPFGRTTFNNPRRLIKTCFFAIARADSETRLPFTADYLQKVESGLYSQDSQENHQKS